jgi:hypothetical protein
LNGVQDLVDGLASRLGRPVGVDDRRFRAVAYSAHADEIDEVRRISILGRRAPDAVIRWLEGLGLMQATEDVRVPANPDFHMVARVCLPARFHDRLLGFLWLIDDDPPLTDADLEVCRAEAHELAQELHRLRQQTDDERRLDGAWVRAILEGGGDAARRSPGIAAASVYVAVVIDVTFPEGAAPPSRIDILLTEALDHARRSLAPRHQLAAVEQSRATVILGASTAAEIDRHAASLLTAVQTELGEIDGAHVHVGLGDFARTLDALPASRGGAENAVRLSRAMPELGVLVKWSDLGATRLLAELLGRRDPATLLPAALRRLLADQDGELLTLTLEAYLERAGDVATAAADLFIHRSSLYNRLQRIEEVAEIDIRSGSDRLELHLGIRLWRMSGASGSRPSR